MSEVRKGGLRGSKAETPKQRLRVVDHLLRRYALSPAEAVPSMVDALTAERGKLLAQINKGEG